MALTVAKDAQDFLGTTYGITSNQVVVDMKDEITELEPNIAPYTTLLMHPDFNSRAAQSVKIEWLEHEQLPITTTSATVDSGTATATSIVCAAGTGPYFRPNDLVRVESTGELLQVTALATDTLTVVRGIGAAAVDFGTAGVILVRIANMSIQAGTLPEIRMVNTTGMFNYTHIERTPYGMSRSASQTKQYGGDPMARERATQGAYHKRALEEVAFFGKRNLQQTSSRPQTTAGGLAYYVTANVINVNGNLTAANLATYSRSFFRYSGGSNRKFAFCAPLVTEAIAQFSIGKTTLQNWDEGEQKYGIKANLFVNGAGDELVIINKRNWKERGATGLGAAGSMFIVDMDCAAIRALQTTICIENRQAPDYDGKKNEWLTEQSYEIIHGGSGGSGQGRHGWLTGITGYA
jgi:hypothetical protein